MEDEMQSSVQGTADSEDKSKGARGAEQSSAKQDPWQLWLGSATLGWFCKLS